MVTSHSQDPFWAIWNFQLHLEAEGSETGPLDNCDADARTKLRLLGEDFVRDGSSGLLADNGGALLVRVGERHHIAFDDLNGEIDQPEPCPGGMKS